MLPFLALHSLSTAERCIIFAKYITENNATVRDTAAYYGASKSTVHKDVTERLKNTDSYLYDTVRRVLEINKSERHLRGGNATKLRYELMRKNTKNGY
jgi:putative DeoR family transcriptional regulator (stage III sporulation protein D)